MIIQILSNLINKGYLNRSEYSVVSPFFGGANVAFRREALVQVGLYDVNCRSGEDQDICFRLARAGWEQYFEPEAKVKHRNQMSFKAYARKWFDYGFYHPYVFRKHTARAITIFIPSNRNNSQSLYSCLFNFKAPFRAIVFLNAFLGMLFFVLLCFILLIIDLSPWAIASAIASLVLGVIYFWPDIQKKSKFHSLVFISLRCAANSALLLGGFLGGVKTGMLYLSGTL